MSTHIQDRLVAVRFDAENIALVGLSGDNNVIACDSKKRVRSWCALAVGWSYVVVGRLCEIAGGCEGGCIRWYGERHTTPEAFISRGRKAIKEALTVEETRRQRQIYLTAQTAVTVESATGKCKWLVNDLNKIKPGKEETHYGDRQLVWHWNIYDPSERSTWLKLWNSDVPVYRQLSVSGPGTV